MAQETDDKIFLVIWNIIWIQEFLKGFFTIALMSTILGFGS